ncbi:glutamate-5-semialdehyde dehydrogenase [Alicyclobacillus tolerans]|uniref:glutamate-5-semialdehyde dehydrogenase n=1 Tax=Alicyclobacillus tolerans TaxID=90970 RepID=UPI001F02D649|nr:glutamate-5-semialdehyde dehydrogenase [Alicyclobacillus tolerans]MCF8564073.1 glutamate-5-semialdehyde dehydrogenase [Alicyclobacillus tolerans]
MTQTTQPGDFTSELQSAVYAKLHLAKAAATQLGLLSTEVKNTALLKIADALWESRDEILAANQEDVQAARADGQPETRIDRLLLTEQRIRGMMDGLAQVAALPDPIGTVLDSIHRPNGLRIEKVRVPMGVIAMVYESRPNVTVDAASLAFKTGNAAVLRGGREALQSNAALVGAIRTGLAAAGVTPDAVQFIDRVERESVDILIRAKGMVDLAIPRGGAGLISLVTQRALVPVIETGVGNCHVYVDAEANLDKAEAIAVNAKVQRPSVCNAAETLLVHQQVALDFLPRVARAMAAQGVQLRGCERTLAALKGQSGIGDVIPASQEDWETEYNALILAVRVVDSLEEAMTHIGQFGTQHSEAIVTEDVRAARKFLEGVDAAAVYHNASTRFTDGFEFGFGAEIGISTQKLHARGPMGLNELTSYKYMVYGNGQVRG